MPSHILHFSINNYLHKPEIPVHFLTFQDKGSRRQTKEGKLYLSGNYALLMEKACVL